MLQRILSFVGVVILSGCSSASAAERVLVEWRFDRPGQFQDWTAGGHVAEAAVADGALRGRPIGHDPNLLGPVFEISAAPNQIVEVRMASEGGGTAQLFWTHTLEGRFGGFAEARSKRFVCRDGGQFHVYRIYPFWHPAGKIIRLRLDPPASGPFAVASIRVLEGAAPPPSEAQHWSFAEEAGGWQPLQDVAEWSVSEGALRAVAEGEAPIFLSPPLAVSAAENPVVSLRMAADSGTVGRVFCVSRTQWGWSEATFQLRSDGHARSYHLDVAHLPHWRDEIIHLAIQPTNAPGAAVAIESVHIAAQPQGPPDLELSYSGSADGVHRAGRAAGVVAAVRNVGGEAARDVAARLSVPPEVRVLGEREENVARISRDLPESFHWQLEVDRPGAVEAEVTIASRGEEPVTARATLDFTLPPELPETDYVPEPQPVESAVDLGIYYFPGWPTMTHWQPILDFPERKPVLGWYDEADPEVADWQIKWAVEHGITFFMVDWYWNQGHRHLEHWLHEAYMESRYREHLQWAVMWANHNPPDSHSLEDWREVTQYWIDHYFGMEEYYRIDGRPAVFIWAPRNIRQDVGGAEKAAELYALSQGMAREAGLPGIYFVAMSAHESEAAVEELEGEGYEAFTSYHGFYLARDRAEGRRFPFSQVVETGPETWQQADARSGNLHYIPVIDTGWASEPWHRQEALVIYGRTPELFGALCRKAREYAEANAKEIVVLGPWNEWGEGSYIEPFAEYGFDYLEELRAAFCPPGERPPAVVPADVGLGPYDLPPLEWRTAWTFEQDGDMEHWTANAYLTAHVEGGLLHGVSTGFDPILHGPAVRIDTETYRTLVVRMKSDTADMAQLFWGTALAAPSETNSIRFPVHGDGAFHEYRVDLGTRPSWRGLVTTIRFDPVARAGIRFAIDSIRLE